MNHTISTISIIGCGWLGLPLAKLLMDSGYRVRGSTTTAEKVPLLRDAGIDAYLVEAGTDQLLLHNGLLNADLLLINIPPGNKSGLGSLYAARVQSLLDQAAQAGIGQVIMTSSTGVYPDACRHFDEQESSEPDTPGGINIRQAELAAQNFPGTATIVRCGGLFGPGRDPARFFAGKTGLPDGQAPVNMLSLQDAVNFICQLIRKQTFGGVYNACSPSHPAKQDYYRYAALRAGLALPEFREEAKKWKVVHANRAANELNFHFSPLEGFAPDRLSEKNT
ncbi:SDR family oxidoreductase [Pedobacter yulinensis]|nr:SDR family oxidoreductase [Pedobacter yulinensis]